MDRPHVSITSRFVILSTAALLAALAVIALSSRPAHGDPQAPQAFHLAEIYKIMAGYNGNTNIQAVEIRMNSAGQNLVNGLSIVTYDANANPLATLGTFTANVANGTAGRRILCATTAFQTTFGITADLTIAPGIPAMTGQVSFEEPACRVNTIPYGNVNTPLTSPTVAPFLPVQGATILIRRIDSPVVPSCPLSEDAGLRLQQKQGSPASPDTFTNNANQSVFVSSTITGTEGSPPALSALRASPNPSRGSMRIEAPDWGPLSVHDIQGRLVRVLTCAPGGACPAVAGPFRGEWDGTDLKGREVPSGIYFLRYVGRGGHVVKRIALIR